MENQLDVDAFIHISRKQGRNVDNYQAAVVYPLASQLINREYSGKYLPDILKKVMEENSVILERPYVVHISRID